MDFPGMGLASYLLSDAFTDALPAVLVGLFAIGISLSFWIADRESPSTRAFALFLALIGFTFASTPIRGPGIESQPGIWDRLTGVLEATTLAAACEWLLRVARTISPRDRGARRSVVLLRAAQAFAMLYGLEALLFLDERRRYSRGGWGWDVLLDPTFLLVFGPILIGFVLAVAGAIVVGRSDIDGAERVRLRAAGFAAPFLFSGLPMRPPLEYVTTAIGELIFLGGAIRYHVIQGQRGQFLGRFLSPQVARLVRERGLAAALEHRRSEISVVAFDLRGFTAFAETSSPEAVMGLVQDYYAFIGETVTHAGATIKDFAGDGILCLVGAPLPEAPHAGRALALGRAGVEGVTRLLAEGGHTGLSIGAGIASGPVTTGAVGGETRLEYAAVGPAVNLAARLCEHAGAGEILADAATIERASPEDARGFHPNGPLPLKGIARPVMSFRRALGAETRASQLA
jgi:adenylate cyclase